MFEHILTKNLIMRNCLHVIKKQVMIMKWKKLAKHGIPFWRLLGYCRWYVILDLSRPAIGLDGEESSVSVRRK